MIKQITFENWKSFRHATLQIDPFMALIGARSSGKTNALEALMFISRTAQRKNVRDAFKGDVAYPAIRGGAEGVAFRSADQVRLSIVIENEPAQISYCYSVTIEPGSYLVVAEKLVSRDLADDGRETVLLDIDIDQDSSDVAYEESLAMGLVERIDRIVGMSGLYTSLSRLDERLPRKIAAIVQTLQNIVVLDPDPATMRSYTPLSDTLHSNASNIAGVLANLPQKKKIHIESVLSRSLARLPDCTIQRVWAEPVGRLQKDAMIYAEEPGSNPATPILSDASTMPDRVLRFLAILTAILIQPAGALLAIEQVDSDMHLSHETLLLDILREIGRQHQVYVLVTTHNPALPEQINPLFMPVVTVVQRDPSVGESSFTRVQDIADLPRLIDSTSTERLAARNAIERAFVRHRKR